MKYLSTFILILSIYLPVKAQQLPSFTDNRRLYDEALELYDKNLFEAANYKWEQFIATTELYPQTLENDLFANAKFFQATSAYFLGKEDLMEKLTGFMEDYPTHSHVPFAQFCLGMYYFDNFKYKAAVPYLNAAAKSELFKAKDASYLAQEDRDKLAFALGYSYFMDRSSDETLLNADDQFIRVKDPKSPYYIDAVYYHGLVSYKQELYAEAYNNFVKLENHPKYGKQMPLLMANCLLMMKKYDDLQTLADRLVKQNATQDPQILFLAASTAYERRDYAKAARYYDLFDKAKGKNDRITLIRSGYSRYKLTQYKEAIPILEKAASENDSISQAASYYLGFCFQKDGQNDNARYAYKKASQNVKGGDEDMAKDASYQYAKLCFATQNYSDAMKGLTTLNDQYPNAEFSTEIKEMIGEIFSYTQNYVDAIPFFESGQLTSTRSRGAYQTACYYYGLELLKRFKFEEAEPYLEKAVNAKADAQLSLSAKYWLAESQFMQNHYDVAMGRYFTYRNEAGAKQNEYYSNATYGAAWCYFKAKKYTSAVLEFEEFLKEVPKGKVSLNQQVDANARIGDCYFIKKEYPKAIKAYQKVVQDDFIGQDYALYQLAEANYRLEKYDNSVTHFDKLIKSYPSSDMRDAALDRISEIYLTWKKNPEKAELYAKQLVKEYPRNPLAANAYNRLGIMAYEANNIALSSNYFRKVLNDFTYDTDRCKTALDALSDIVEPSEFDEILKEYKVKNPNADAQLSEVTMNTARARYYAGNYGAAIELLTNFLSANQKSKAHIEAVFLRAESYRATSQNSLALTDYAQVYNEPVQNEYTTKSLDAAAKLKFDAGDYDGSMALYQNIDKNSQVLDNKINAKFGIARNQMAKKEYQSAITSLNAIETNKEVDPSQALKARVWMGNCQYGLKQFGEAEKSYKKVIETDRDELGAEAQYMLVRTYYAQAKHEEAIEAGKFLKNNFGDNEWKDRAVLWMAEANISLKNTFQAKSLLEEVIASTPYSEIKEYAEKRLEEIKDIP